MGRQELRARARADRRRGFSLVEVIVAIAVMTLGALILTMSLSSAERMNSLARERQVANAAIRSYVEAMRQKYPEAQNSQKLSNFFSDTDTPASPAYLPQQAIEGRILKDLQAYVVKCRHENPPTGSIWVNCGNVASTTSSAVFGPSHNQAPNALTVSDADRRALGYNNGAIEIDADTATSGLVAADMARLVPCKIELTWISGSAFGTRAQPNPARQRLTVYVMLNPLH